MILKGNCLDTLKTLPDCSVDSIVTDPPYELGFMGKSWDNSGIAYNVDLWRECLRVLKPGGHLLAFSGTRTYHRMVVAIEDSGFEIRDQIMWIYGSGFPKSLDVSKAIDKAAGAESKDRTVVTAGKFGSHENPKRNVTNADTPATPEAQQWQGWGTALKPAHEPIVVARKPLIGTVAQNVLEHGTGALNIDGSRVGTADGFGGGAKETSGFAAGYEGDGFVASTQGRWPANVIHDGSDEVLAGFPNEAGRFFYCLRPLRQNGTLGWKDCRNVT
jgi:site-specific DNA-methyltransferase (adenine-specific)